jgi:hypothetical protein
MNIAEIEAKLSELVREPFAPGEFALRLLEIYDAPKATITKLRNARKDTRASPPDLIWSPKLLYRLAG